MHNTEFVREEIRRDDDELVGFVQSCPDSTEARWLALSVFGGLLAEFDSAPAAREHLESVGLSVLDEPWWFRPTPEGSWYEATLVEARPDRVRCLYVDEHYERHVVDVAQPGPDTLRLARPA